MQTIERIVIFGRPGSGKSTFAKSLSQRLNVPLLHLDCYYFTPNWTTRDSAEFLALQHEIVRQDRWIVDGNCLSSLEMRFARADAALYFNRSKCLCYWRVFKRSLLASKDACDRPVDCPDGVPWKLVTYMWKFDRQINRRLPYLRKKYPHVELCEIRSDADLAAFVTRVAELNRRVGAEPAAKLA